MGVEKGRDVQLVVKQGAVLAVVAQAYLDMLVFLDRFRKRARLSDRGSSP